MARYVVLPRLIPVDNGQVFVYGDRALVFGRVEMSQAFINRMGLRVIERALNPIPTILSLVVFDRDIINYAASAQICKDGNRGLMFAINGSQFYDALQTDLPAIMAEAEVDSLEGYVVPGHSRLMTRALRKVGRVQTTGHGRMNDHAMDWVVVRAA
jgi:hypothetical protein